MPNQRRKESREEDILIMEVVQVEDDPMIGKPVVGYNSLSGEAWLGTIVRAYKAGGEMRFVSKKLYGWQDESKCTIEGSRNMITKV